MKQLAIVVGNLILVAISLAQAPSPTQKPGTQQPQQKKNEWKVARTSINDCIATRIDSDDRSHTEVIGTYPTKADAVKALQEFKKMEDPKKAGFEMCM